MLAAVLVCARLPQTPSALVPGNAKSRRESMVALLEREASQRYTEDNTSRLHQLSSDPEDVTEQ